mgnify:CR=1 FL=1
MKRVALPLLLVLPLLPAPVFAELDLLRGRIGGPWSEFRHRFGKSFEKLDDRQFIFKKVKGYDSDPGHRCG